MSGYWDAVERAASGRAGEAQPRARSLYEPDTAATEGFEIADEEIEAAVTPAGAEAASVAAPRREEARVEQAGVPGDRDHVISASASGDEARQSDVVDSEPSEQRTAASRRDDVDVPVAMMPSRESVPHVEIHRSETVRTIVEAHEMRLMPVVVSVAAPGSVESEPMVGGDDARRPDVAATAVAPVTVISVPAATREPAGAPVEAETDAVEREDTELAPLVIEIGRIDIRIAAESGPAPVAARPRETGSNVPSLQDYLAQRSRAE